VGVNFSRNFGKESAIFAGLETAKGDACVLLDCDLQFPPEVIIEMYNIWKNNDVDIVEGRKNSRGKENPVYKFFSLWYARHCVQGLRLYPMFCPLSRRLQKQAHSLYRFRF